MFKEGIEGILRTYRPERLNYEERLHLLKRLREEIEKEEGPLRSVREQLQGILEQITSSDLKDLKRHHYFLNRLAIRTFDDSRSVKDVHLICTRGRDAILRRILELIEAEFGSEIPPYAWMALGSAGRQEETLYTDQDYLLVYRDGASDELFLRFSHKAVDYLEEVGIRRCKGGVMPVNEKWRASLGLWRERIRRTVERGRGPLSSLDLMILMDLRFVAGERSLGEELVGMVPELTKNRGLLNEMLKTLIFIPLPLGLFGRFLVEKSGPQKGRINLKVGGWAPLVVLIRVMAVSYGIRDLSTLERIEGLKDQGVISRRLAEDLKEAYHILMELRISGQRELMLRGEEDSNYIDPYALDPEGQRQLKFALRRVEELQKVANELFFGRGRW